MSSVPQRADAAFVNQLSVLLTSFRERLSKGQLTDNVGIHCVREAMQFLVFSIPTGPV